MAFRAFPAELNAPLRLEPGAASGFVPFDELASGGAQRVMFLRIVKLGGCVPPGDNMPLIRIRAKSTTTTSTPSGTLLSEDPNTKVPIRNRTGSGVQPIAYATYLAQPREVYLVRIEFTPAADPSRWAIQVGNRDPVARRYTWVVADSDAESQQPWINLPQGLSFRTSVESGQSQKVTEEVNVANFGTGDLVLSPGVFSGEPFEVTPPEGPIRPNSCGRMRVSFLGTATSVDARGNYLARSNDGRADGAAEHNAQIALKGSTVVVAPPPPPPPPPDPPDMYCLVCSCPQYRPGVGGRCRFPGCGHSGSQHHQPI